MKLKKTILGLAVVAVAGVNAWLANDASARNNVLSLLNLENVADAYECDCRENIANSDGGVTQIHAWCDESSAGVCPTSGIGYKWFGSSCKGTYCEVSQTYSAEEWKYRRTR